jgi:hypothetical protein
MILYRPIGKKEYDLIKQSNFKEFPPRLSWQPIFYPVLNREYARKIAEEWNTKDENSDYVGIVTEFYVIDEYIEKFEKHIVGSSLCEELWIPAEELEEFNKNIRFKIKIIEVFYGEKYKLEKIEKDERYLCFHDGFDGWSYGCPLNPVVFNKTEEKAVFDYLTKKYNVNLLQDIENGSLFTTFVNDDIRNEFGYRLAGLYEKESILFDVSDETHAKKYANLEKINRKFCRL